MSEPTDPTNPDYYKVGGGDLTDLIVAYGLDFCRGNAVKYLFRAGRKGDELLDARKALWYVQRWIERLTGEKTQPSAVADDIKDLRLCDAVCKAFQKLEDACNTFACYDYLSPKIRESLTELDQAVTALATDRAQRGQAAPPQPQSK